MKDTVNDSETKFSLIQLLPNVLTITAICAGMSAIRFGVQGNYELAVKLIMIAAILDGIDGRLARLLGSSSQIGAELDSLADFLNFGVAPSLIIYFWALQDLRSIGWIATLIFAICCVIRLARFNVSAKADDSESCGRFFEGIPSPAGALLVMFPMYFSFTFTDSPMFPDVIICIYMVAIGLLLISHIPTWSFKNIRISHENVKFFLISVVCAGVIFLTFPWITLILLCFGYVGAIIWASIYKTRLTD